jgi:hypothetical protein
MQSKVQINSDEIQSNPAFRPWRTLAPFRHTGVWTRAGEVLLGFKYMSEYIKDA